MNNGVLVLAAGVSRRFGSDKRRYLLDGKPLLVHCLDAIAAAGLPPRVCIGPDDGDLVISLGATGVQFIECDQARRGMGATLAQGVARCDDWDGVLVALGDMPWVLPETFRTVSQSLLPGQIVQPVYENRPGQPVAFSAAFFDKLRGLDGDIGGRELLREHENQLLKTAVNDPGIHQDVDTPPMS